MARHNKDSGQQAARSASGDQPGPTPRPSHPPPKRPVLLAASIVLFVLWLAFLITTALVG